MKEVCVNSKGYSNQLLKLTITILGNIVMIISKKLIESKFVSITANQIQMMIIVGKVEFVVEE
jgi:hypothetical protein